MTDRKGGTHGGNGSDPDPAWVGGPHEDLIRRVREAGAVLEPTPEGGLRLRAHGLLPGELVAVLRASKAELLAVLHGRPGTPVDPLPALAADMGLDLADVREAAGPDYDELAREPDTARAFLAALRDRRDREAGRVSPGMDHHRALRRLRASVAVRGGTRPGGRLPLVLQPAAGAPDSAPACDLWGVRPLHA